MDKTPTKNSKKLNLRTQYKTWTLISVLESNRKVGSIIQAQKLPDN